VKTALLVLTGLTAVEIRRRTIRAPAPP